MYDVLSCFESSERPAAVPTLPRSVIVVVMILLPLIVS
jgi:hypothetical protein